MGTFRLVLAWCVVIEHLSTGVAYLGHTGMFAVMGFYVLSGYLITRILNEVYAFQAIPFWCNRFLRLYPTYFIILVVALAVVLGMPGAADFFPAVWAQRPQLSDWIGVLTIVPMGFSPMSWTFRPVPSIWSVGVELLNYAVLFAFAGRRLRYAVLLAAGAACYHAISIWRGGDLGERYFPFHAALLPFALGAIIYFLVKPYRARLRPGFVLLLCLPALVNCIVTALLGGVWQNTARFELLFYLNLAFQCLAVVALASRKPGSTDRVSMDRIDKLLGDLSYPVFLIHWLIGYAIATWLPLGEKRGIGLMLATLVASTAAAYIVCLLQNTLLEPLRDRIRAHANHQPADTSTALAAVIRS